MAKALKEDIVAYGDCRPHILPPEGGSADYFDIPRYSIGTVGEITKGAHPTNEEAPSGPDGQ
jgi:hypothetical protein